MIFGLNFREEYKGELILEDVWGTPGNGGSGEWKKRVNSKEFEKVNSFESLRETTMYFSLEEFVLMGESEVIPVRLLY